MKLLETWRSHRSDYRRRAIHNQIEYNLARQGRDRYSYLDLSNIRAIRKNYENFGASVGEAIRNEDISEILELANDSVRVRHDWIDFIDEHFPSYQGEIFRCNDCEVIEHRDNSARCYHDYLVCESCRDNYEFDDHQDTWVREEDLTENGLIGEYHSSRQRLGHIPSAYDDRKPRVLLGLELEIETENDRNNTAQKLLDGVGEYQGEQYALLENDASLDHGFEMVTAYTGLDVHQEQLSFFKDDLYKPLKGAKSHDTSTCGLHVHICKSDMTTLHGAKMILFINDQGNERLIKAIARRDSSYGSIKNKKDDKSWIKESLECRGKRSQLRRLNRDRYEALNFQNDNTVEFRLFKGSLKYDTIMACLEFTYATWFFCREASTKNLTIDYFLKFICANENRKDTKFLRAFLKSKGFSMPESNVHLFKKVA
jgi:hypothetical protein